MGKANLTYYIFEGVLFGTLNGRSVHIFALSGGGATKKHGMGDDQAVNNPYRTNQLTIKNKQRGGPIPTGKYFIKKPAPWKNGKAARLEPANPVGFFAATGRDGGFLIHARGGSGSDGCIVPVTSASFDLLIEGLEKDGGGTLWVVESMGGSMFA